MGEDEKEEQPISEKQGFPRNEEFNYRKGEDNYGLRFGNDKIQFDNAMNVTQVNNITASLALQGLLGLQNKLNDLYLAGVDAREKAQNRAIDQNVARSESEHTQRLEHGDEEDLHARGNDRKTLDALYNLSAEEAAGIAPVLSALLDIVSKKKPEP